jgi:hypothetical protein
MSFDDAWARAMGAPRRARAEVTFPHATEHRRAWREVLSGQREAWRAAFERRETPLSSALAELLAAVVEDWSSEAARAVWDPSKEPIRLARVPVLPPSGFAGEAREIAA